MLGAAVSFSASASASQSDARVLRIGYIESSFFAQERLDVDETFAWLRATLPQYDIKVRRYSVKDLEVAIRDKQVEFFLGASGFYRRVFHRGLRDLATMTTTLAPDPGKGSGALFLVRRDSPYRTFDDLKGLRAATSWTEGFTGVFIPQGEIVRRGEDPEKFFRFVTAGSPVTRLLDAVLDGSADVAMARACTIELLYEKDPAYAAQFRPIGARGQTAGFHCLRSTDLYPNWTFVSTTEAPWEASSLVTRALLSMPKTARGSAWGVVSDFAEVDELYKTLKRGPYAYLRVETLGDFIERNKTAIAFFLMLIAGLILHSVRTSHLVRTRTAELQSAIENERRASEDAKAAKEAMEKLQQVSVIGAMSSLIAHELNGPLSAIANSVGAIERHAQNQDAPPIVLKMLEIIDSQCEKAALIVAQVRGYAKRREAEPNVIDLQAAAERAVTLRLAAGGMPLLRFEKGGAPIRVRWDMLEAELAVTNLIKNAVEAIRAAPPPAPLIEVRISVSAESILLAVTDNALTDAADLAVHSRPLTSSKTSGLGLGLLIVKTLVEKAGGHFSIDHRDGITEALIRLPVIDQNEKSL